MSNYSDIPNSCRVDFFRESGKWYATESIIFNNEYYKTVSVNEAFAAALRTWVGGRYSGMTAVCLEPYHEHSHPVSIKEW